MPHQGTDNTKNDKRLKTDLGLSKNFEEYGSEGLQWSLEGR